MKRTIVITIAAISIAGFAHLVSACLMGMPHHEVSELAAQTDSIPPARPTLELAHVTRGKGPVQREDGLWTSWSTDDLGIASLNVLELSDDQTLPEKMGLRMICLDESSEVGNHMAPSYDFRPFRSERSEHPKVSLSWIDGAKNTQEPLSETFAVYAIDLAGNVSVEADTVVVVDPGRP